MNQQVTKIYDIYHHPEYGYRTVRRGFSWLAFLVPSVWAVRRDLGMLTLVMIVITTAVFDLVDLAALVASNPISQLVILACLLVLAGIKPGFFGYRWHARALEADGFRHVRAVGARSARQALKAATSEHFEPDPIFTAAV